MALAMRNIVTIVLLVVLSVTTTILIVIETKRYTLMKSLPKKSEEDFNGEKKIDWGKTKIKLRPAPLLTDLLMLSTRKHQPNLTPSEEIQLRPKLFQEKGQIQIAFHLEPPSQVHSKIEEQAHTIQIQTLLPKRIEGASDHLHAPEAVSVSSGFIQPISHFEREEPVQSEQDRVESQIISEQATPRGFQDFPQTSTEIQQIGVRVGGDELRKPLPASPPPLSARGT